MIERLSVTSNKSQASKGKQGTSTRARALESVRERGVAFDVAGRVHVVDAEIVEHAHNLGVRAEALEAAEVCEHREHTVRTLHITHVHACANRGYVRRERTVHSEVVVRDDGGLGAITLNRHTNRAHGRVHYLQLQTIEQYNNLIMNKNKTAQLFLKLLDFAKQKLKIKS